MKKRSRVQHQLDDNYLKAIGLVAAEWANLERNIIDTTMYMAFEYPWQGNVYTTQFNSIYPILKILDSLLHDCNKRPATIKKFGEIRGQIESRNKERNRIVHAVWAGAVGRSFKVGIINYRKGKRLGIDIEPITPDEILLTADEIAATNDDFKRFARRYILTVPAFRKRPWKPYLE